MARTIGIDPGKRGGIAFVGSDHTEVETLTLKQMTDRDVWEALAGNDDCTCVLEKVHAGPKIGSSASFKFGDSFGCLRMAAIAAGVRLVLVSPQKWQKEFGLIVKGRGLGQDDTSKKNRNKAKAQELFPSVKVTHAIADALLIAEYGRRLET